MAKTVLPFAVVVVVVVFLFTLERSVQITTSLRIYLLILLKHKLENEKNNFERV